MSAAFLRQFPFSGRRPFGAQTGRLAGPHRGCRVLSRESPGSRGDTLPARFSSLSSPCASRLPGYSPAASYCGP